MADNINYEVYAKENDTYIYKSTVTATSIYNAMKSLLSDKGMFKVKDVDFETTPDNMECVYISLKNRENENDIIYYMLRPE